MPQTRELLSFCPDGSAVVFTQELRESGWYNLRARSATPEEIISKTLAVTGKSGSDNDHARLSPSSAERWSRCTIAPAMEAMYPDRVLAIAAEKVRGLTPYLLSIPEEELKDHEKRAIPLAQDLYDEKITIAKLTEQQRKDILRSEGSKASREGVRAHDFAEAILRGRRTIETIPVEFQRSVGGYVEHCLALVPKGETPLIEYSVPLFYTDDNGTLDFGIVTDERVTIRDYKNGIGKLVRSVDNDQLGSYALSLIKEQRETGLYEFSPDTLVDIMAYQPNHHEADFTPWIITLKDLEDFCRPLAAIAADIEAGRNLKHCVSDATCGFCVASGWCEANAAARTSMLDNPEAGYSGIDLLSELPDDNEIPDTTKKAFQASPVGERLISRLEFATNGRISALSDEQMVELWNNSSAIGKLLDDIDEHLKARVLGGEKIGGLKIVLGREGNREWKNEEAVKTFLRGQKLKQEDYIEFELMGPAKVEKIPALAAKMEETKRTATTFAGLIARSDARKTIASIDDKRPEASSMVDELPDEGEEDIDEDAMLR